MIKILLRENMTWNQKKNSIEASLIMGFYSSSAEFPIASKNEGMIIPDDLKELDKIFKLKSIPWPRDYISATKQAKPILDMDWRKKKGLESIFSKGFFIEDKNLDQLPDELNFKISIPENCNTSILLAACNFAFRFGMETTAYEGPIIAKEDWQGNLLVFKEDNESKIEFIEKCGRKYIYVYGNGEELEEFSTYICETFPNLPNNQNWIDRIQYITDSLSMRNLDGQLAYLNYYQNQLEGKITAFMSPEIDERINEIQSIFPNIEFKNHKSEKKIYEKNYDIQWEVDVFKKILEEKIYPNLKINDEVEIFSALSEEINIRTDLVNGIKEKCKKIKVKLVNIDIISAYKQGYSWIEEIIIPQLKEKSIDRIEIEFKPFLPSGKTHWLDEDGATPTYGIKEKDPDRWLDIPIRFLQELYPVDDLIAQKLEINRDHIKFLAYEGEEDIRYKVKAFNSSNELILTSTYKVRYSERPYLDEYPEMGKVHPSTGFISVIVNGKQILYEYIKTDLEKIWNIYQAEVLPECKNYIENKTGGNISIETQPFFSRLNLEVSASEPNYDLDFREDMISSLNSFHEDMYFVGADYFKNYSMKTHNILLDAPGLILPLINKSMGKPEFKVTLYDQLENIPCIKANNKSINGQFDRKQIELYIEGLKYSLGKITAVIKTNITDNELIESYMQLLDKKLLKISSQFSGVDIIEINTDTNTYSASIIEAKEIEKDLNILDIDLMENTLIGYEEYIEIIEKLKRVSGIKVYQIATSYLGRKIFAIEILTKDKGYISRTKMITNKPSEIINSRHHANEVSSTNAAFILLKKLLVDEEYKTLPDRLNLVIVPLENVDGTAIHYELQKNNPNWKLHVARFNAVGKEFYYEHFNPDTIHTEAMGLTWLWEKYLPDIIVDNHGVPSHEWEQPFSGYTSPSFKGFWLPRSLLYGYFWMVSNEEYKSNYDVNKKIEEVIAEEIAQNNEITKWNKEWISIFEKYAHSWMPKLFPANYYNNMINYWISFEFDSLHRYPSIRFPWITTVAYTSEVADETAQGDYLNLCARAHVAHDEAIIQMLLNSTCLFEEECHIAEDKISISSIRHRPIIV